MERVGLYLRLSREDGEGESGSIESQRLLLRDYCRSHHLTVVSEYIDDGYSGLSFHRPGFEQMLGDIEKGLLDTVLTKDLSRLGRDYILTGHYLERYFPEKGVRYIALGDNIDTGAGQDDLTPFRAVVNDLYARDISRKVRAALDARKRAGVFIGARPPYGYQKEEGRLRVDPQQGEWVQRIFAWCLLGDSCPVIARKLGQAGCPSPTGKGEWSGAMVRRILTNPTYKGDLTQNRSRKISCKVEKSRTVPKEGWVICPGACPPLVGEEDFARVQEKMEGGRRQKDPLASFLRCAQCGSPMGITGDGKRRYLVCRGRKKGKCTLPLIPWDRAMEETRCALKRAGAEEDFQRPYPAPKALIGEDGVALLGDYGGNRPL